MGPIPSIGSRRTARQQKKPVAETRACTRSRGTLHFHRPLQGGRTKAGKQRIKANEHRQNLRRGTRFSLRAGAGAVNGALDEETFGQTIGGVGRPAPSAGCSGRLCREAGLFPSPPRMGARGETVGGTL